MAQTPVEVKKSTPARAPDVWQSFRTEMDRMFDRCADGFGLPAFRRMFDADRSWWPESSFSFSSPAVDVTEADQTYKITAEVPGLEEKNIDVTVLGDMLTPQTRETLREGRGRQEPPRVRACLRRVPALLCHARRRRPQQDRRPPGEGRADDHTAENRRRSEAAEEDRGQDREMTARQPVKYFRARSPLN
jgi:hypothetical protein